jgi:nucleoside-diphosphate-sugar epimerase
MTGMPFGRMYSHRDRRTRRQAVAASPAYLFLEPPARLRLSCRQPSSMNEGDTLAYSGHRCRCTWSAPSSSSGSAPRRSARQGDFENHPLRRGPGAPPPASVFAVETYAGDLSLPGEAEKLVAARPDLIFHLAAIVSGEAEADFDKGYRINLDGTRYLYEAIRKAGGGYRPKLIFTSSIAVFGAPFPDAIPDEFFTTPLTSYGTQKAIGELLLADYSRRGFFDGIGLRFPTICVRPGKPNLAASGFFSGIIREPLAGPDAILPVAEDVRHWRQPARRDRLSLRRAPDTAALARGAISRPGLPTVGEQIAALRRIAGEKAVAHPP